MNIQKTYRRLVRFYLRPLMPLFLFGCVCTIIFAGADAFMLSQLPTVVDKAFIEQDPRFISKLPFVVAGLFCIRGLFSFGSSYCVGVVGRRIIYAFRKDFFAHLLRLPASYMDQHTQGEILSKMTYNIEQIAQLCSQTIVVFVREFATVIFFLVVMMRINWILTCIALLAIPFMFAIFRMTTVHLRKLHKSIQDALGDVSQVAREVLAGFKVIKAYNALSYEQTRFAQALDHNQHLETKEILVVSLTSPLLQSVGGIFLSILLYIAIKKAPIWWDMRISVGEFTTLITVFYATFKPVRVLSRINAQIQRGLIAAQSIFEFLDLPIEVDAAHAKAKTLHGGIRFEHVGFEYQEGRVLHDVSFDIAPGKMIAIVGRSGAGKSTLAHLIVRLYNPTQGLISFDGTPMHGITLESVRTQVSLVSQNVVLFNGTIYENIAYSCANATQEQVESAARKAHIHHHILSCPQGYQTHVGDEGVRLSGGQRQRIALARALLRKSPIVILDEATSALDHDSERAIFESLELLRGKCTLIVIAHRLSTIAQSDHILFLEGGQLVAQGNHQELIAMQGSYARWLEYAKGQT